MYVLLYKIGYVWTMDVMKSYLIQHGIVQYNTNKVMCIMYVYGYTAGAMHVEWCPIDKW